MNQITTELKKNPGRNILLLSPLVVVPIGFLTAFLFTPLFGVWTWAPMLLVYWTVLGILISKFGEKGMWKRWLQKPKGKWMWSALPFIFVVTTLPIFFEGISKLWSAELFFSWLLVGLINPVLEEGYWRGLLQDMRGKLPIWMVVFYSSILFSMNHLALGINSITLRNPIFLINTFVLGVVYSVVYYKTKSLKWLIITHALMDLLSLSVLCFLGIYVPPKFG